MYDEKDIIRIDVMNREILQEPTYEEEEVVEEKPMEEEVLEVYDNKLDENDTGFRAETVKDKDGFINIRNVDPISRYKPYQGRIVGNIVGSSALDTCDRAAEAMAKGVLRMTSITKRISSNCRYVLYAMDMTGDIQIIPKNVDSGVVEREEITVTIDATKDVNTYLPPMGEEIILVEEMSTVVARSEYILKHALLKYGNDARQFIISSITTNVEILKSSGITTNVLNLSNRNDYYTILDGEIHEIPKITGEVREKIIAEHKIERELLRVKDLLLRLTTIKGEGVKVDKHWIDDKNDNNLAFGIYPYFNTPTEADKVREKKGVKNVAAELAKERAVKEVKKDATSVVDIIKTVVGAAGGVGTIIGGIMLIYNEVKKSQEKKKTLEGVVKTFTVAYQGHNYGFVSHTGKIPPKSEILKSILAIKDKVAEKTGEVAEKVTSLVKCIPAIPAKVGGIKKVFGFLKNTVIKAGGFIKDKALLVFNGIKSIFTRGKVAKTLVGSGNIFRHASFSLSSFFGMTPMLLL
jgi:hypothetical protein